MAQLLFSWVPRDCSQLLSSQITFTVQFRITVAKINLLLSKWKELSLVSSSLALHSHSPSCSTFHNLPLFSVDWTLPWCVPTPELYSSIHKTVLTVVYHQAIHCGIRLTADGTWEVRQTNLSHSVRAVTLIYTFSSKFQQGHSQSITCALKGNSLWATAQNTDRKGPWQSKVQTGTDNVCVSNLRQSAKYQRMLTSKLWAASEKFALEVMKYTYTQFI